MNNHMHIVCEMNKDIHDKYEKEIKEILGNKCYSTVLPNDTFRLDLYIDKNIFAALKIIDDENVNSIGDIEELNRIRCL